MDILVKYAQFIAVLWCGVLLLESKQFKKFKNKSTRQLFKSYSFIMLNVFQCLNVMLMYFVIINTRQAK